MVPIVSVFKITDHADQQFGAVLDQRRTSMRFRYNPTTDRWSFDLAIDDEPVLHGRRIVLGINLLAPFDFKIGRLFAWYPGTTPQEPGRNQLIDGRVELWHMSQAEVDAYVASVQP